MIDPELPKLFGKLYRTPFGLRPDPGQQRAEHDDRLLPGPVARRFAPRLLLREPLPPRGAAEVRDGSAVGARGGARPSPADRARAGADRPAGVPSRRRLHGLHRGLGALLRAARLRPRPLQGPVLALRAAHLRPVARRAARRRHRHPRHGLDAPAGHRLFHGERGQDRGRHRQRDRPLHLRPGPGARLQDRPAEVPGTARARRSGARRHATTSARSTTRCSRPARCRSTSSSAPWTTGSPPRRRSDRPAPQHRRGPHRCRHRGRRRAGRRPVDDQHRHGGRRGDGAPGARARRGGFGARARDGQYRRSGGGRARMSATGSAPRAATSRSSATSTSTATSCSPRTRPAPRRSTSTASTPATSAAAASATRSSPR